MKIITVELLNDKALLLLKQLEQLNILRLVTPYNPPIEQGKRQWAGSISNETVNKIMKSVEQSRNEWDRNI
jgi:hypothetical protein